MEFLRTVLAILIIVPIIIFVGSMPATPDASSRGLAFSFSNIHTSEPGLYSTMPTQNIPTPPTIVSSPAPQQSISTETAAPQISQQAPSDTSTCAQGLSFAGYTNKYTGALGGAKGANTKCDAQYDGSHWCSVDELMRLGDQYSWTHDVWVRDAVRGSHFNAHPPSPQHSSLFTMYGGAGAIDVPSNSWNATCAGWTGAGSTLNVDNGPILSATKGRIDSSMCNASNRLACCR